jgi:hypothetical protein
MKKLQLVEIKCQCGHVNLIPVTEVFHVYEPIKCEKCAKTLTKTEQRSPYVQNGLEIGLKLQNKPKTKVFKAP